MKKLFRFIMHHLGILSYLQVFREKYFPTEYYKAALRDLKKYIDFYSQFILKDDLCFDIGANRGDATWAALELKGFTKVIGFEPAPKTFYQYVFNFASYKNIIYVRGS